MDVKNLKKVLGVGLLTAAAITNSNAYAAQANVQVDVDLPTVLVMYHYDVITLELDEAALTSFFIAGTNVTCTGVGGGNCQSSGNTTEPAVPVTGASTIVTPTALTDAGATGNTTTNFLLEDVVGVRAFGCATYAASYSDGGSDTGVTIGPATPLAGIDGATCGFGLTTGDLAFDLDFSAITPAGLTPVSAIFDVTITGV